MTTRRDAAADTVRARPDGAEIVHFVCYGNSAGYRPDLATDLAPESAEREAWVEVFLAVAPGLRGRIRAVHVQTWEHCFAVLSRLGRRRWRSCGARWTACTSRATGRRRRRAPTGLAEARRVADAVRTALS